jgi:hypothetical protein
LEYEDRKHLLRREREREREREDMYMIFGGPFDKFIWFLIGGRF